jgi:hypothetical protein
MIPNDFGEDFDESIHQHEIFEIKFYFRREDELKTLLNEIIGKENIDWRLCKSVKFTLGFYTRPASKKVWIKDKNKAMLFKLSWRED